jgi:glycosyltransferase involved in cell wall biosynthesis
VRVVFYTRPSLLDPALSLVRELARQVEVHLLLEITPESWRTSMFDVDARDLPSGIVPGGPLTDGFPAEVRSYWQDVASFNLVVHTNRRSLHPATWWTSHQAMRFMQRLRPDVVHFDDASLRLGWTVRELGRIPVIFSVHDPEPHTGENDWRTHVAYWLTLRRAARFILHSLALKSGFCARFGVSAERVDIVRLAAYDLYRGWARAVVPECRPTVLFFGRLSPYKGLEVLYQAAPSIVEKVPNVRFVVAGQPIPGYALPTPPAGCPVEVLNRYISNAELAQLFQQASVVVCPYVDATQSGVIMTAYAFDMPVVATRVGGLPEYVHDGQTGLLVPERDAGALAAALVSVLTTPALREHLVDGIRVARTTEFDWSRAARETVDVYARAIV